MTITRRKKNINQKGKWLNPHLCSGETMFLENEVRLLDLAVGLKNYYNSNSLWANRIATALALDVCNMSRHELELTKQNKELSLLYSDDFFDLMYEIGKCGIVYSSDLDRKELGHYIKMASRLYLTERSVGIPLDKFLLQYKGIEMSRAEVSRESGIPAGEIEWAYKAIVKTMREALKSIHERQDAQAVRRKATEEPVRPAFEDIELLVDFSNRPRRMTGEMLGDASDPIDPMEVEVPGDMAPWDEENTTTPAVEFDQIPFSGKEEPSE